MQNFQDIFETRKRSFINSFSIFITVPLRIKQQRIEHAENTIICH